MIGRNHKLFLSLLSSTVSVQSLSHIRRFVTPWTAAHQISLSITNTRGLPTLMSIESVMPSNHFTFCRPLLLLPSIFPSIRVFSNESALHMRWPKYWSFSFNISPSNEHPGLISLQSKGFSRVFSNNTVYVFARLNEAILLNYLWKCFLLFVTHNSYIAT